MVKLNKKADGGITAIIIVVIILVFIGWLVAMGNRECNTDSDCGKGSYCGSDFACHEIPVIEKSASVSFTLPALILGIAMIITAVILKWEKLMPNKSKEVAAEKTSIEELKSRLKAP